MQKCSYSGVFARSFVVVFAGKRGGKCLRLCVSRCRSIARGSPVASCSSAASALMTSFLEFEPCAANSGTDCCSSRRRYKTVAIFQVSSVFRGRARAREEDWDRENRQTEPKKKGRVTCRFWKRDFSECGVCPLQQHALRLSQVTKAVTDDESDVGRVIIARGLRQ